jgi:hypothetical protein
MLPIRVLPMTRSIVGCLVAAVLLLVAVPMTGCGGGGGGAYYPAGTLEVFNQIESGEIIVDIEVDEIFGGYYAYFYDQDVFPGDSWFVDLFPSTYDVTLYWSDFFVETYRIDIFDGSTTTIFAFQP